MLALWDWRRLAGASWRAWLSARGPGGEAHTRTTIAFVLGSQDRDPFIEGFFGIVP